jgi:hypothetical protein
MSRSRIPRLAILALAAWLAATAVARDASADADADSARLVPAREEGTALDSTASTPAPPPAPEIRRTRSGYPPRRPLHDLAGTFVGLGSDLVHIAGAPLRMDGKDALVLGGVLGVTAGLYAADNEIYEGMLRSRGNPVYDAILWPGNRLEPLGLMSNTNPYYLGSLAVGYALDIGPLRDIPAEILESHAIAGGIRNGVKALIGRRHPYEQQGSHVFQIAHGTSFPSGHSSVDFELATILSHHVPWWPAKAVIYGAATSMVLQRVDSSNHWPSDVFISAVYGHLVARTVVHRHERRQAEGKPMLGVVPAPGGFALTCTF